MYKNKSKFQVAPLSSKFSNSPKGAMLKSNMCQLQITLTTIYQYSISFIPPIDDSLTQLKKSIVKGSAGILRKALGNYVHSGNDLYSFRKIPKFQVASSVVDMQSKLKYEVLLSLTKEISLKDVNKLSLEQSQELEMIFNIYLRKVMEEQKLCVLKSNRYLNLSEATFIAGTNLKSVTGYFVSISAIKEGLYLTIDTITEFFRNVNCLKEINDMRQNGYNNTQIGNFFRGKRVSLLSEKGKTWRINGVNFELCPATNIMKPNNVPMIEFWENKYKVKVTDPKQPLFKAKKNGEAIHVIPEFCYITGIEEEAKRFGKGMNELGGMEPFEKDKKISEMFKKLEEGQMLEQYGLTMLKQTKIPLQILPKPQLNLGKGRILPPEMLSKGAKIMKPINFKKWIFIYEERNYESAENLLNTMKKASGSLGISIEDPEWFELTHIDFDSVSKSIDKYKGYQFTLALISDKRKQYKSVKKVLDVAQGMISQCVYSDYKKMENIPFASNIIRQINAKLGGDLYSVELPREIPKNTMFIGIDVCHYGRNSVVGFYSNTYTSLAKCYCETSVQKRGQEIVSLLIPLYSEAFRIYMKHEGKLPEYIFIYRDGVGRSQRSTVLSKELPQLKETIACMYPDYNPQITLVIVNKRIHQRFLTEIGSKVSNPEPGTIIDTMVTENGCENFYMISARARKGTIKPTHFYIAHNERKEVTKIVIQQVSYAMSFMYYNTPWSVKIPAQIALADKKAYYVSIIDSASNKKLALTESFL